MHIVMQAHVGCCTRHTVSQDATKPTKVVPAGLSQHCPDSERGARMSRWKRAAALTPLVDMRGLIWSFSSRRKLKSLARDEAKAGGFQHRVGFGAAGRIVDQRGEYPSPRHYGSRGKCITQAVTVLAVENGAIADCEVSSHVAVISMSGANGGKCSAKEQPIIRSPSKRCSNIQLRILYHIARGEFLGTAHPRRRKTCELH